jgi:hypothetical protein
MLIFPPPPDEPPTTTMFETAWTATAVAMSSSEVRFTIIVPPWANDESMLPFVFSRNTA